MMDDELSHSVSVVIVNYDKVETTLTCVEHLERSEGDHVKEIIVVDNGSSPDVAAALARDLARRARLVRLGANRYFGEGNNIGVEEATGDLVLLLNNDAYVAPSCIDQLVSTLRDDPAISAVGAMLLYPDGSVQEVGGVALPTGDVVQIGKGAVWTADHYTEQCPVDYCSAACLLLRRRDFLAAGGFALQWEPAYYEDVDLCLTIWEHIGAVVVNPRARVVHLESLTTSDSRLRLESQVEINRLTFVAKWGEWLRAKQEHRPRDRAPAVLSRSPAATRRVTPRGQFARAAFYTPYDLIPGGGERVLFELATVLVDAIGAANVHVVTPHRYSELRMLQLNAAFGLDGPTQTASLEVMRVDPPDLGVVLGNTAVPPIAAFGRRRNVYICQFPFAAPPEYLAAHAPDVASFDEIWVYSNFVRRYVNGHLRLLGVRVPRVRVVYPPATIPAPEKLPSWGSRGGVMTVGRFFKGAHNKRQDVVIDIVRRLTRRTGRSIPLIVAGALHPVPDSRDRFRELVAMARGLDCHFYPNASLEQLVELYEQSAVFVHATGFGIDRLAFPERLEHFGIVPIEAASLGCIPVVYGDGGPVEVMDLLDCPTTFRSIPQAVDIISGLLDDPVRAEALSRELVERSTFFSREAFRANVHEALAELH
jgi:GT2 family glycosyltransferase/glycosyltransferase involved in cell wall biosynthesis